MNHTVDPEVDYYQNYLRRELLTKIKEDALFFEFIHEDLLDGIWYLDLIEPENEWMSPMFWKTLGYDPQSKRHHCSEWQALVFEEDLALLNRNLDSHLQNPNVVYDQIVRFRHENTATVWIRRRGVAIYDLDGNPIRMVGSHVNVSSIVKQREFHRQAKYNNRELVAQLDKAEKALAAERLLTKYQKKQLQTINQISDATDLWFPIHATKEAEKLHEIACRLQLPFNLILIQFANYYAVKNSFGDYEVENKFAGLNKLIKSLYPNLILSHFDKDIVLGIQVGYSEDNINAITQHIEQELHSHRWSIITPLWNSGSIAVVPKTEVGVAQNFRHFFDSTYSKLLHAIAC